MSNSLSVEADDWDAENFFDDEISKPVAGGVGSASPLNASVNKSAK